MSIASVMTSRHLILWHPLLLPSIFLSIRDFSNESALCIGWSKYWSFSFNIGPSKDYSGLISLKIDWLDLLVVQGTLRGLLQHHSSEASVLRRSAFTSQLSHPYMTTGKTEALTTWNFVGRVVSLLSNTLSRFAIAFLLRSNLLWFHGCRHRLQRFWAQAEELCHCFRLFPSICRESGGWCHGLGFFYLVLSQLFHSPPSPASRGSLVPLCFLSLEWFHPHIWGCWCFSRLSWFWLVTHPPQHFSRWAQHIG